MSLLKSVTRFRGCWICFLLLSASLTCFAQALPSFEAEKLSFSLKIDDSSSDALLWEVSGDYFFSNQHAHAISQPIAFPIPSSANVSLAVIHELSIIEPSDSMAVSLLSQNSQSIVFKLDLPPRSFAGVRLSYSQKVVGKEAVYTLSTAKTWGKPLSFCEIKLFIGNGIKPVSLPFADPQIIQGNSGNVYYWQFIDFVPLGEFVVIVE